MFHDNRTHDKQTYLMTEWGNTRMTMRQMQLLITLDKGYLMHNWSLAATYLRLPSVVAWYLSVSGPLVLI